MARSEKCERHDHASWAGHIICDRCRTVYLLEEAPAVCGACGDRLLPDGDRSDFTARLVCAGCAESLEKAPEQVVGV